MSHWPEERKQSWDEARVVRLFVQWLREDGWNVETEKDFVDVVAERHGEKLLAEVKGRTNARPGAGADSLYGQLLRRMPPNEVDLPTTRFAVVVPDSVEFAVLRVPKRVRSALRIDVYVVTDDDQVRKASE